VRVKSINEVELPKAEVVYEAQVAGLG